MKKFQTIVLLGIVALAAAACQTTGNTVQTASASAEMPPVSSWRANIGDVLEYQNIKGNNFTSEYTSVTDNRVTGKTSGGCEFVFFKDNAAPGPEWKNCSGSSGTQTSKLKSGGLFPLAVGNRESWEYSGTNTKGNSWSSVRNCEVADTASVTVPAGTFDTYHVICEDKWWKREWFVNADGVSVISKRTRKAGAQDDNRFNQLVSFTPGAST